MNKKTAPEVNFLWEMWLHQAAAANNMTVEELRSELAEGKTSLKVSLIVDPNSIDTPSKH